MTPAHRMTTAPNPKPNVEWLLMSYLKSTTATNQTTETRFYVRISICFFRNTTNNSQLKCYIVCSLCVLHVLFEGEAALRNEQEVWVVLIAIKHTKL